MPDGALSLGPAKAAALAARADVTIVFATQFTNEGMDAAMALDGVQDQLIDAVARANPRTIVVLETGGPVAMPWLSRVPGVIEAWYPRGEGGSAIADISTGRVDSSGRLPVTFPASLGQLPNPELLGARLPRPTTLETASLSRSICTTPNVQMSVSLVRTPGDASFVPVRPRPVLHPLQTCRFCLRRQADRSQHQGHQHRRSGRDRHAPNLHDTAG